MRQLSDFDYMLDSFDYDLDQEKIKEDLRKEFVTHFTPEYIRDKMTLEEYAIGSGRKDTFCYWIERKLRGLGSIIGATASKFGIYMQKDTHKYIWTKRLAPNAKNVDDAFKILKGELLLLLDVGKKKDYEVIDDLPLSPMVKLKILSLYYPDKYLNFFGDEMITYCLFQFYGQEMPKNISTYDKEEELIKIKNASEVARNWTNAKFGDYLYHLFPNVDRAKRVKNPSKLELEHPEIKLRKNDTLSHINDVVILDKKTTYFRKRTKVRNSVKSKGKVEYIKEHKEHMEIGLKGEKLVLEKERERLKDFPDLRNKISQLSLVDDAAGYDILSYETDGSERYIEVKSTKSNPSKKFSFVLTENERQHAEKLDNYWLYEVFNINTDHPEIFRIKHPFSNPENIQLQPTRYQATIKVKDLD